MLILLYFDVYILDMDVNDNLETLQLNRHGIKNFYYVLEFVGPFRVRVAPFDLKPSASILT